MTPLATTQPPAPARGGDRAKAALTLIDDAQHAVHADTGLRRSIPASSIGMMVMSAAIAADDWHGDGRTGGPRALVFVPLLLLGFAGLNWELRLDRRGKYSDVRPAGRIRRTGASSPSEYVPGIAYLGCVAVGGLTGWWWCGLPTAALAIAWVLLASKRSDAEFDRRVASPETRDEAAAALADTSSPRAFDQPAAIRAMAALVTTRGIRAPALRDRLELSPEVTEAAIKELRDEGAVSVDRSSGAAGVNDRGPWITPTRKGRTAFREYVRACEKARVADERCWRARLR